MLTSLSQLTWSTPRPVSIHRCNWNACFVQVAVIDGFSFPHLTKRLNVAGRHVTTHLVELLLRRGYAFNRSADFDTVRQMKEKLCYVACDYQKEVQVSIACTDCAFLAASCTKSPAACQAEQHTAWRIRMSWQWLLPSTCAY